MKTTNEIPEGYRDAIRSGKIEYAQMDHPKAAAIKTVNLLRSFDQAGINLPSGSIGGDEIDELIYKCELRGIFIPEHKLSGVEKRNLADKIKDLGLTFRNDITVDMTPSQRSEYEKFLVHKRKFDEEQKQRQDGLEKEFNRLKAKK